MNAIQNKNLEYEVIIQNERERISSLIHNQLAQDLTALSIHSQAIQSISGNNEVLMHTHHISNLIKNSREHVKDLIWHIDRHLKGPEEDLFQAINNLLLFWKNTSDRVTQKFKVKGDIGAIPASLRSTCFEAIKEAVTNVYRHACSENLFVTIDIESESVDVLVSDDGVGFYAEYSNGLNGISNKLKSVHGSLKIFTSNDCGTTLHINIPFKNGL